MKKKILTYALATTMVGSLFALNVQAQEPKHENISLPVQFYDFDADGLFYEYSLYDGMDTFGLGESNNEGVTAGLVEDKLGDDGLPVYKRSSIESAAKTIQENLAKGKTDLLDSTKPDSDKVYTSYNIFKHFTNNTIPTDQTYTEMFGSNDDGKRFYDKGWNLDSNNISNIYGTGDTLHSGMGTIWQQESDGIINYGVEDHLTKVVDVEANQKYTFDYWRTNDNDEIKFKIYDAQGNLLIDNSRNTEFTPTTDKVKIDLYREGVSSGTLKVSVPRLTKVDGGQISENYLGDTIKDNFLKKGWESKNYNNVSKDEENGRLYEDGINYWQQDGDGIKCLNDSSITFNTEDSTNQMLKIGYWLDNGKESRLSIDILDDNGILTSKDIKDNDGFNNVYVDVPKGTGKIKVRINGKAGSRRIAALNITPLGSVLELGDYNQTVEKYNQGKLNNVNDCMTCMDYAYLRLKNFYNTDFSLNKSENKYNQMILNRNVKDNGKVEYTFDSSKEIKYSGHSFENTGTQIESSGFFPLDYMNSEKHSDKNENNPQYHNYHFGMKIDGYFTYEQGSSQFFNFSGDDDIYFFINGKLVIDLGGAHKEANASLDIEQYALKNGIKSGEKCHFQMFYLERHTTASNCKIQTNLNIGKRVEYKFESGTEGKELPDEIIDLTPVDDQNYFDGTTITISDENRKFDQVIDQKNNGVWKFVGWDKESKVMEGEGIQFVGKWVFISNVEAKPNDEIKPSDDKKDNPQVTVNTQNTKQKESSQVKTGDDASLVIYGVFVLLSVLGILLFKKKAHN